MYVRLTKNSDISKLVKVWFMPLFGVRFSDISTLVKVWFMPLFGVYAFIWCSPGFTVYKTKCIHVDQPKHILCMI